MQRGSLQLILLVMLGLTAVFSVATFASENNPLERPITTIACKLNRNDIACQTPSNPDEPLTINDPRPLCIPDASKGAICPSPTPTTNE